MLHSLAFHIRMKRLQSLILYELSSSAILTFSAEEKMWSYRTSPDTSEEKISVLQLQLCQYPPQSTWVSIMFLQPLAQISAGKAFLTLAVNKWLRKPINLCRRGCLQPTVDATVCHRHADGMGADWKAPTVSLGIFAYILEDNSNKLIKYQESIEVWEWRKACQTDRSGIWILSLSHKV